MALIHESQVEITARTETFSLPDGSRVFSLTTAIPPAPRSFEASWQAIFDPREILEEIRRSFVRLHRIYDTSADIVTARDVELRLKGISQIIRRPLQVFMQQRRIPSRIVEAAVETPFMTYYFFAEERQAVSERVVKLPFRTLRVLGSGNYANEVIELYKRTRIIQLDEADDEIIARTVRGYLDTFPQQYRRNDQF